uniref:Uncharacterized protein n=1 Tax=Euplotes harpa TaxID=151035 RepID=A0A7S3J4X7_9SPIT|mmetsp:Transcript_20258/g.23425  ORF Transcript_20258/g.23425 Transcript_20258/m.23425 type:complete len:161 (+) Transcript_20258:474-956(+)
MIEEAYKILKKYDMLDQIFWGSFKELHTQELIRVDQSIPRFASQKEITVMNLAYLLGFLPFISIPFDLYLSPFYNEGLVKTKPEEGISECKRSLGLALIRFMTLVSAPMISHLDKRGIDTMLWVLNDVEDLARALEIEGSPGVITDRPEAFISLLHKRYS